MSTSFAYAPFVGQSPLLLALLRAAQLVAATTATTLITGESGSGKELLARMIHQQSRRADAPLVVVNCAALPEALLESELFGHRRGAFSGAVSDSLGRVAAADGGTLFMDEIGELPLPIQAKLLRLLEAGEIQRLGVTQPMRVDVRIIAATHQPLEELVEQGRFRDDLYHRLLVVPLELPPLRERREDIPLLLEHFARLASQLHQRPEITFSRDALRLLRAAPWRGNVRELRHLVERLTILCAERLIEPRHLPADLREEALPACRPGNFNLPMDGINLELVEQQFIRQALARSGGNRSQAARLLGLTRDTLLYRLKKYSIS
jgi:DNA-binding NtrC family response regulator